MTRTLLRRTAVLNVAFLLAQGIAVAQEPFPFPAPPRHRPSVYLSSAPAADSTSAPSGTMNADAIPSAEAPKPPAADRPAGQLIVPARKSVVADTTETDRRVERLQRQLDELHQLLSRPPVEPPVIERSLVPIPPEEPPPATPLSRPQPEPVPPATPAEKEPPPGPPAIEPPAQSNAITGLIKGLPTSAIDRVHVADNLFAAGEYVLANEVYDQVDRKGISTDESGWVEFQLANCARRAGRLDEARKRYRRVVADPALGWLQDMAKWRLDAIDEREALVREHTRLEAAIKQLSETPRAAAKP
jgi:hypothetical protein